MSQGAKSGTAGKGRTASESYVVELTAADRRRTASVAEVKKMAGKGVGLLARRDLPAFTMVAAYPGQRFTERQYAKRREAGLTDSKFAVDFWRLDARGAVRTGYVIDPGSRGGKLLARFSGAAAPLVNEPGPRGAPNLIWVWNLPRYRLEHWTFKPVRRGEELTLCYGTGGGYVRSYATACVSRPGEVEPELHVVTRAGARPVPYSSLGNSGVRAAMAPLGRRA